MIVTMNKLESMTLSELYDEWDAVVKITKIDDYKTLAFAMKMANRSPEIDYQYQVLSTIMIKEYNESATR